MEWKKETWKSFLKLNKERLIFLFCSGLLLFILALPAGESQEAGGSWEIGGSRKTGSSQGIWVSQNTGISQEMGTSESGEARSYELQLESRVRTLLRGVEGVGEVEVMVMLKQQEPTAMFEEEETETVLGVIISADGGGSAVVKTEISEAMEALFGLPPHKIKVLKRVKKGV